MKRSALLTVAVLGLGACIEHGVGLTDDLAARMARQRVTRVPTMVAFADADAEPPASPFLQTFGAAHRAALGHPRARKVAIAAGSDVIAAGALADLIGTDGDPSKDLTRLRTARFVMKGGAAVTGP